MARLLLALAVPMILAGCLTTTEAPDAPSPAAAPPPAPAPEPLARAASAAPPASGSAPPHADAGAPPPPPPTPRAPQFAPPPRSPDTVRFDKTFALDLRGAGALGSARTEDCVRLDLRGAYVRWSQVNATPSLAAGDAHRVEVRIAPAVGLPDSVLAEGPLPLAARLADNASFALWEIYLHAPDDAGTAYSLDVDLTLHIVATGTMPTATLHRCKDP